MKLIVTDPEKAAREVVEFRERLVEAMDAMSQAAAAVYRARQMSPTVLELGLLRSVAGRACDLVADLHVIATSEELER